MGDGGYYEALRCQRPPKHCLSPVEAKKETHSNQLPLTSGPQQSRRQKEAALVSFRHSTKSEWDRHIRTRSVPRSSSNMHTGIFAAYGLSRLTVEYAEKVFSKQVVGFQNRLWKSGVTHVTAREIVHDTDQNRKSRSRPRGGGLGVACPVTQRRDRQRYLLYASRFRSDNTRARTVHRELASHMTLTCLARPLT
jgi:hypothetical protein